MNHLKRFSQQHQLSFEVKNRDHLKYDMAKREHMKKQEKISEGYYPMGKKASYNDNIPTVKIVIEHTRQIEEGEQLGQFTIGHLDAVKEAASSHLRIFEEDAENVIHLQFAIPRAAAAAIPASILSFAWNDKVIEVEV